MEFEGLHVRKENELICYNWGLKFEGLHVT